ncbi:reverse transcriptase family protein [Limnoglobus roseus]|uniref:RNA-directed DNA polymerase n=1 Tax=Limnoglobus roseus TaxID=2598579 RepID=A0A5C1AG54_9BACT|nr:reverse transcriptase family protein [Limnoglobus roseus]QEL17117.1 RNA-directed DNA polymerase [Limnoglobus roseus]
MGFWDFLPKLFKPVPSESPPPSPSPIPAEPVAETFVPVPPMPVAEPPAAPPPGPIAVAPPPAAPSFLPITRDDLLKQGEEVRRTTGWMFFGRRDLIPPTSDPRTLLIDRGMVTQGLLTPDELAEMHRVGDEHAKHADRFRQITIKAGQTADQAVEADRAARVAIKAQKKAAAAAFKQTRADAVAVRRATDIIFVGRDVSAMMNDRSSDAERLKAAGLPVLHTPSDLAAALGLAIPQLRWLCFHTEVATRPHYVQFEVPKKAGGTRTLAAPHAKLAAAQEWVLANVLAKLPTEEPAHGFVPGRSTVTNALPHAGRDVVVNVDLEGFFPAVRFPRVRHLFRRLGYSGAVATLLALLGTECSRKRVVYDKQTYFVAIGPRSLPQGACTSPAVSNQIARRLDRRLAGLAKKLDWAYTRYADDLTFSAPPGHREQVGYLLARVRHMAAAEGFALNAKKTRVQRPESRQAVTGLVVNAAPAVPRDVVRRVRAILHRAKHEGLDAQNRTGHPNFRGWVEGMIAYVAMVKPTQGEALRKQYTAL